MEDRVPSPPAGGRVAGGGLPATAGSDGEPSSRRPLRPARRPPRFKPAMGTGWTIAMVIIFAALVVVILTTKSQCGRIAGTWFTTVSDEPATRPSTSPSGKGAKFELGSPASAGSPASVGAPASGPSAAGSRPATSPAVPLPAPVAPPR